MNATDERTHFTVIVQPDFLDVGIAVETGLEDRGTYWCVFSRTVTWMGFSSDIRLTSEKSYLKGTIEGLEQTVIIELPSRDVALAACSQFHEINCIISKHMKLAIKTAALAYLGSQFA